MNLVLENKKNNAKQTANFMDGRELRSHISNLEHDLKKTLSHTAHEVRNPLAAMELHSRAILKRIEMGETEAVKTSIECILRSLESLKDITDNLSSYSKDVRISTSKANLAETILSAANMMKPLFNEKFINLDIKIEKNLICNFDTNKTHQVIINILKNALEATESKGNVTVWSEQTPNEIKILIKDTGCGIPQRIADKIFFPNFTTKQTGSGIGLCESKKIARAQGGDIELIETSHKGSVFALIVPA